MKNIKRLIENIYTAADPRIILTSKPLITPSGKDPIPTLKKVWLFTSSAAFVKQAILG